ncbi:hypothetical protein [Streptomyces sp. TS71-3]|uniref:hypothetical protein n=1 Tax=Streptomyces sp. TS71-3 TaxID=2733862 RepID=UPI001B25220C|nr:hypothetical protein [Streptomyces sp. TS71-3]GHJ35820.1 hypothetical protein Sm713_14290 [Streptomyces sp. TS71-3]
MSPESRVRGAAPTPGSALAPALAPAPAQVRGTWARRGTGDPVKALLQRHRELCERAVDPLELAAGLEAAGITDRMAARYRHRDVFSLAEEMYARVARDTETDPALRDPSALGTRSERRPPWVPPAWLRTTATYAAWLTAALLPAAACALTLAALRRTGGRPELAVAAAGALAMAFALRVALRRGPLRTGHRVRWSTRAWTCLLLAYALLGDALLRTLLAGAPDVDAAARTLPGALAALASGAPVPEAWRLPPVGEPAATAAVLALALAVLPAACCARLFAAGATRRVGRSRDLAEFTARARPLLLAVLALYACALALLLTATATVLHQHPGLAGAGALGVLLMLARLLMVHGFTRAPALLLAAAGAAEALALAAVLAARLPGCAPLAVPVARAVAVAGPGAVPAVACGTAALVLLAHAGSTLTRASAHTPTDPA